MIRSCGTKLTILAVAVFTCSCAGSDPQRARSTGEPTENSQPSPAKLPASVVAEYLRLLPGAAHWDRHPIPRSLLRVIDRQNDSFLVARDTSGDIVGYVRRLQGPVNDLAECGCNPLNVEIVLNAEYQLVDWIERLPLEKYGHEPITPEERARLKSLVQEAPSELLRDPRISSMVDAKSGATKPKYVDHVVRRAAFTTKRLIQFTEDTRKVIDESPQAWDEQRLVQTLEASPKPVGRTKALLGLLPTLNAVPFKILALRYMLRSYTGALGESQSPNLGDAIFALAPTDAGDEFDGWGEELMGRCPEIATIASKEAEKFAKYCLDWISAAGASPTVRASISLPLHVRNMAWGPAGRDAQVLAQSGILAKNGALSALATLAAIKGNKADACRIARQHYNHHPRHPRSADFLAACPESLEESTAKLDAKRRSQLLKDQKLDGAPLPTVDVENEKRGVATLDFAENQKITILVAFASWCPHCQQEMPALKALYRRTQEDPRWRDRVRFIALRTSVERETESFEAFQKRFEISFPVYVDAVMSLAFSKIVQSQGLSAGLPTLLVADSSGYGRFRGTHGHFTDTAQEVGWMVDALLE